MCRLSRQVESAMRVPKTQSEFHLRVQGNAFHRDARQQSISFALGIDGMSLIPSIIETRSPPGLTRSYPRRFYVDHSHYLVLAPATLAALPSTRAIPDRDVFYVADPVSSIPDYSQV